MLGHCQDLACAATLLCYPLPALAGGLVSSRVVTPEQNMSPKWDHKQMPPAGAFLFSGPHHNPKSNPQTDKSTLRN